MGPPTARQLKSLPAAPPAAPQKGAVALPRGVCSSSIRLIFRPIFLPPPVTCASSGDADSTLSIIDILALCLIFQTLADILLLHQTKAPAYPSSLQYQQGQTTAVVSPHSFLLALAVCPGVLGVMPIVVGKGQHKYRQWGRAGGKLAIMARLKTPQMKETNQNCMMMVVTIILDVLGTAVNKSNSSNKIVMMVAIFPMTMIII